MAPVVISTSASRREQTPALAMYLFSLISDSSGPFLAAGRCFDPLRGLPAGWGLPVLSDPPGLPGLSDLPCPPVLSDPPGLPGLSDLPCPPVLPDPPGLPGLSDLPCPPVLSDPPGLPGLSDLPCPPVLPDPPGLPGLWDLFFPLPLSDLFVSMFSFSCHIPKKAQQRL